MNILLTNININIKFFAYNLMLLSISYAFFNKSYGYLILIYSPKTSTFITIYTPVFIMIGLWTQYHHRSKNKEGYIMHTFYNLYIGLYCLKNITLNLLDGIPKQFGLPLLKYLYQQDWSLYAIYLSPFIATCFSIRYLLSHWKEERMARKVKIISMTHGSARLALNSEILRINDQDGFPVGLMPPYQDTDPKNRIDYIKAHDKGTIVRLKAPHALVVAPTRSGKGVGIVIPTLLEYKGPVLVTDIKGENYTITNRFRKSQGRTVYAFDPYNITQDKGVSINILKFLKADSLGITDDAAILANLICPTSSSDGSNTQYFQSQAAGVIQCLLIYVVCSEDVPVEEKKIFKIYDLLCLNSEKMDLLLQHISDNISMASGVPSRIASSLLGTDYRERSGVLNSARLEMRFIDSPLMRAGFEGSQFELEHIVKGDIDLFICLPSEKIRTHSRILRLITGIIFVEMQRAQGAIGPYNLLMLMDEMPALGHLSHVEDILIYGAGYGISLLIISQTIEMIRAVYPKTWKTFFSNQLILFFACTDDETCEVISKKLGKKTIFSYSNNVGSGSQQKDAEILGSHSSQEGNSYSESARDMLLPDEVKKMGNKIVLAFYGEEAPIFLRRLDYRFQKEWTGHWDENKLYVNRK